VFEPAGGEAGNAIAVVALDDVMALVVEDDVLNRAPERAEPLGAVAAARPRQVAAVAGQRHAFHLGLAVCVGARQPPKPVLP
jgi:hypothetical protein